MSLIVGIRVSFFLSTQAFPKRLNFYLHVFCIQTDSSLTTIFDDKTRFTKVIIIKRKTNITTRERDLIKSPEF